MGKIALAILTFVNVVLCLCIFGAFVLRGAAFRAPWDGPAVVTVVLAAATLVLGAVAIGVALLAVWGYTTLREHAANVARKTASETAESTATRAITAWLDRLGTRQERADLSSEEPLTDAYRGEGR
jgi:hypothetical protein